MIAIRNAAQIALAETVTLQTTPDNEPQLLFDYSRIEDPAKRESARYAARQIKIRSRRALTNVWEVGKLALETQNELGHGLFIAWANAEFGESVRTVQRWRDFASRIPRDALDDLHASLAALLEATAPQTPDHVLEQVLEKATSEPVTKAQVRALRDEHRPQPARQPANQEGEASPEYDDENDGDGGGDDENVVVIPAHEIEIDAEGMWRMDHLSTCNRALGSLRRLLADANNHGIAAFPLRDGIRHIEEYILSI